MHPVILPAAKAATANLLPGTLLIAGGIILFKVWASHSWYYNWKGHRQTAKQRQELEQQLQDLQQRFDDLQAEYEQLKAQEASAES